MYIHFFFPQKSPASLCTFVIIHILLYGGDFHSFSFFFGGVFWPRQRDGRQCEKRRRKRMGETKVLCVEASSHRSTIKSILCALGPQEWEKVIITSQSASKRGGNWKGARALLEGPLITGWRSEFTLILHWLSLRSSGQVATSGWGHQKQYDPL